MESPVYNPKETEARFLSLSEEEGLPKNGDRVLVALSGGVDSVTLLHLLICGKERIGFELAACHIHHMIRGEEADRDLEFCRKLCSQKKIPFFFELCNVPEYCRNHSCGMEEGARILRYRALDQVAAREGYGKIATAHNANDQCETLLFRLFRGTGVAGCAGIPPIRDRYIRPLLRFSRSEIENYAQSFPLPFTSDSSNDDILISRNRIRHHIIKEAKEINPRAEESLLRFSQQAKWHASLLDALCNQLESSQKIDFSQGMVPLSLLKPLTENEAGYPVLHRVLEKMTNHNISIDFERFQALLSLLKRSTSGKIVEINRNAFFSIEMNDLLFSTSAPQNCPNFKIPATIGSNPLPTGFGEIKISQRIQGKAENINKNNLIIHLSSDKIEGELFIRNYRSGDCIQMNGMTKTMKKLFCDHGISALERNRIPLLCDEKGILWIPGIGLSDRARPENAAFHQTVSYQITKFNNER